MQTVVKISRKDIWRDDCAKFAGIIIGCWNNAIVKVVTAQGLNGGLVEDQSRKTSIVEVHVAGGWYDDCVETAIHQAEVKVDPYCVVVCGDIEVVKKGKEHVFVTCVQSDSRWWGKVHVVLSVYAAAGLIYALIEMICTGKK